MDLCASVLLQLDARIDKKLICISHELNIQIPRYCIDHTEKRNMTDVEMYNTTHDGYINCRSHRSHEVQYKISRGMHAWDIITPWIPHVQTITSINTKHCMTSERRHNMGRVEASGANVRIALLPSPSTPPDSDCDHPDYPSCGQTVI